MTTQPDFMSPADDDDDDSLYSLRQVVIGVLALLGGLAAGAAAGLSVGFYVGTGRPLAVGLIAGSLAGLTAAGLTALGIAKSLHALVARDSRRGAGRRRRR